MTSVDRLIEGLLVIIDCLTASTYSEVAESDHIRDKLNGQ